ncbi:MAG: Alanine-tRNA ligase, partial [Candidatus Peregrinibacteria bacterium GW2011_GWA2_47_7]
FKLLTMPWSKGGFGFNIDNLSVSCFAGDKDAPRDTESAEIWKKLGIPSARIFFYDKSKNWWGPAGQTGPCGPDTEMFVDVLKDPDPAAHRLAGVEFAKHSPKAKILPKCEPACDCGRYVEVWNDVFMQYNKTAEGKYEPLKQKNVDTGLGLERLTAILQGKETHYETDLFLPILEKIRNIAMHTLPKEIAAISERIIADHLRSAVFMMGDPCGVQPSNTDQGYVLRRLIRRAIRHAKKLGIEQMFTVEIAKTYVDAYKEVYPELAKNELIITEGLALEEKQFSDTLKKGEREFEKYMEVIRGFVESPSIAYFIQWLALLKQCISQSDERFSKLQEYLGPKMGSIFALNKERGNDDVDAHNQKLLALFEPADASAVSELIDSLAKNRFVFSGEKAFYFYETLGFPKELIEEMLHENGFEMDGTAFDTAFKKHQEQSRAGAEQKFAGGLADHSVECTMLHTATHLVHQALRDVLGPHVYQKGSNITRDRLRFDFSHYDKLTEDQLQKVQEIVNAEIKRDLPVHYELMEPESAKSRGVIGLFDDKYAQLGNKVKVYIMGDYSKEICGGPHVEHTGVLKDFTITKEEAVSKGVRRIKAVVGALQRNR